MATRADLRAQRRRLGQLRQVSAMLTLLGYDDMVKQIDTDAQTLSDSTVNVDVPCLVCKNIFPVPAKVGDSEQAEPSAVLCDDDEARINKDVTHD